MFIQTELTPNPLTIKFLPGRVVMEQGTIFYENNKDIKSSPLAKRLFGLDGVESVFLGNDFISVTKKESTDWQILKPIILGSITDHYNANEAIYISNLDDQKDESDKKDSDSDIVKQMVTPRLVLSRKMDSFSSNEIYIASKSYWQPSFAF